MESIQESTDAFGDGNFDEIERGVEVDVLQCPYCALRFASRSELEQHKAFDHPRAEDKAEESAPKDAKQ